MKKNNKQAYKYKNDTKALANELISEKENINSCLKISF